MEGEQLNVSTGGTGTGTTIGTTASNRVRPTAFTRGYTPTIKHVATDNGTSGRVNAEVKTVGTSGDSTSLNRANDDVCDVKGSDEPGIVPDRIDASLNSSNPGRSEQPESGSTGLSGSPQTARRGRGNPGGPRGSYKKSDTGNPGEPVGEYQEEHTVEITVESAAYTENEPPDVPEKKARVKKPKEPPKGKVEEVSASLRDVYQIVDMVTESAVKFMGKGDLYPKDLMCLDDDVSQRLARNLVQLNDAMPKLAARFNTVSVPAMLISTLATDLFGKGVMLYAIVKSPNAS